MMFSVQNYDAEIVEAFLQNKEEFIVVCDGFTKS